MTSGLPLHFHFYTWTIISSEISHQSISIHHFKSGWLPIFHGEKTPIYGIGFSTCESSSVGHHDLLRRENYGFRGLKTLCFLYDSLPFLGMLCGAPYIYIFIYLYVYIYMYMYICLLQDAISWLITNPTVDMNISLPQSLVHYELLPTYLTEAPPCMRLLGYPIFSAFILGFWEVNRTIGQEPFWTLLWREVSLSIRVSYTSEVICRFWIVCK